MAEPKIEEAERRIAEARRTKAESLDLSRLGLRELPSSLKHLSHLNQLDLRAAKSLSKVLEKKDTPKTKWSLAGDFLSVLLFGPHGNLKDLSMLSDLKQLQKICLANTAVTDLLALSGLQDLEYLDLSGTRVTELSTLGGLKRLATLNLSGTGVMDVSALSSLKSLRVLDLSGTNVADISPLSELTSLNALNLSDTRVTDVSALSSLKNLMVLDLSSAVAINLSALVKPGNLQSLNLYGCRPVLSLLILQAFFGQPSLREFMADEITGVPREILSRNSSDNCLPRLRIYFSELTHIAAAESEDRVKGHGDHAIKDSVTQERSEVDIDPKTLTESEKPREVFVSYAWGDTSPEGRIRTEVADRLCTALAEDGFLPIRDRDKVQSGDLISAFIAKLTRADYVVAVVSDKYLRSPYCMYEIYKIWQRFQGSSGEMVRRVVPIVLPEVKVGSFEERAPYLEFWAERAEKLDALVRNPRIRPSRESWEEVRLVQEFAHHVDDILVFVNDVLMPRDLKVHFEGNFEPVREALRRRLG